MGISSIQKRDTMNQLCAKAASSYEALFFTLKQSV